MVWHGKEKEVYMLYQSLINTLFLPLPFWLKIQSVITQFDFVICTWSTRAWVITSLFEPWIIQWAFHQLLSTSSRRSWSQGSLQQEGLFRRMMCALMLAPFLHGSMCLRMMVKRVMVWSFLQEIFAYPGWIQFQSRLRVQLLLHHLFRQQLLWHKPQETLWIMWMNLQPLGAWESNRRWQIAKAREVQGLFNWGPTMHATLHCRPISNKSDLDKGKDLLWCSTTGTSASSHRSKGGSLTKFSRMLVQGSTSFRTPGWCDRPQQVTIATCSCWRRLTTSSWWLRDPWRLTDPYHVENGILTRGMFFPMLLFSHSGGHSWGMTLLHGWTSSSSWRASCWCTWSSGDTDLIRICLFRSITLRTISCGSCKRMHSFPHAWSRCFKVGEYVHARGKLAAGSMPFQRGASW